MKRSLSLLITLSIVLIAGCGTIATVGESKSELLTQNPTGDIIIRNHTPYSLTAWFDQPTCRYGDNGGASDTDISPRHAAVFRVCTHSALKVTVKINAVFIHCDGCILFEDKIGRCVRKVQIGPDVPSKVLTMRSINF